MTVAVTVAAAATAGGRGGLSPSRHCDSGWHDHASHDSESRVISGPGGGASARSGTQAAFKSRSQVSVVTVTVRDGHGHGHGDRSLSVAVRRGLLGPIISAVGSS